MGEQAKNKTKETANIDTAESSATESTQGQGEKAGENTAPEPLPQDDTNLPPGIDAIRGVNRKSV